jgi:hypothetical protein
VPAGTQHNRTIPTDEFRECGFVALDGVTL